jgi:membrane fusion protein (multidrug efflux system)
MVSSSAVRIEVRQAVHPVAATVGGRVVAVRIALNQSVKEGDVLVELDSKAERSAMEEQQALQSSLSAQLVELQAQLVAERELLDRTTAAAQAAMGQARSRQREAEIAVQFAELELERSSKLRNDGLIAEIEFLRLEAAARERRAVVEAQQAALSHLQSTQDATAAGLRARFFDLNRELERLTGERAKSESAIARLGSVVEDRRIRAPVAGTIGDVGEIRIGTVVDSGQVFGAVVPDEELRAVASFGVAEALGRVRSGQPARLRLDGFPWTQYGVVNARIAAVGQEPRNGRIRVEMTVPSSPGFPVRLEHGLTGSAEVEVDRVSPATLVLRAAGSRLFASVQSASLQDHPESR